METAKVDIRKLQLLNDRINQTIEALNQVRMSVHGIAHSAGYPQHVSPFGFGQGLQGAFGYGAPANFGFQSQIPSQVPMMGLPTWGGMGGIAHTGNWQGAMGWGAPSQFGFGGVGSEQPVDPYAATRLGQTFPYAFLPQSPFGQVV